MSAATPASPLTVLQITDLHLLPEPPRCNALERIDRAGIAHQIHHLRRRCLGQLDERGLTWRSLQALLQRS